MTNIYSPIKIGYNYPMLKVEIAKLEEDAKIPNKANSSDAGFDLYAIEDVTIPSKSRALVRTGISMAIPENHVGLIWPRSGLAVKAGIDTLAGVIDSGYRGEVCIVLQNHSNHNYDIKKNDRAAQIIIQQLPLIELEVVKNLNESDRGEGGFGSSGK